MHYPKLIESVPPTTVTLPDLCDDKDGLERVAAQLAVEHEITSSTTPRWSAVPRLWLSRHSLTSAYQNYLAALRNGTRIPAAAEHFVNNFHIVDEQLQLAGHQLTAKYYRGLPTIKQGYPRIYSIAAYIAKYVTGDLSNETLEAFLTAYQTARVLTLGELRALELTLRIALIEEANSLITGPSTSPEQIDDLIAKMNSLSVIDWQKLLVNTGAVDSILDRDPTGVYSRMDLASQNSYRRVIERLAKRTGLSEVEVAQRAVDLAWESKGSGAPAEAHAGYYLLDHGLEKLKAKLNYRATPGEKIRRHTTHIYFSAFVILTSVLVAGLIYAAATLGASLTGLILVLILGIIPASEITALGLRLLVLFFCRPKRLPRIEISSAVPETATTMVVVPTILSSLSAVRESVKRIEEHYLPNQDRNIFFALLTDWRAAKTETTPDDDVLLRATRAGIEQLNAKYGETRFHLFHRRRLWNQSENEWIGWEKKRGKLREFNRLLRGASDTSYMLSTATPGFLKRIKYVITLDSDTELPREGARKLIGTLMHPLNQPQVDPATRFVKRGYAILQPLISSPPPKANDAGLPRILSGYLGVTHRTTPTSLPLPNFSQDLFSEGNYIGKALYDVDVFEECLQERIPENSLLSHDLLEGLYARTGIVADVEVFDEPPAHYVVHSKRAHRWTRGDWQLLPWLMPKVMNEAGAYVRNPLPAIARWKIFDNLRRSLVKPAILCLFVAAWTILPGPVFWWTTAILLMFVTPTLMHYAAEVVAQASRHGQSLVRNMFAGIRLGSIEALFSTIYLAHHAYSISDAVVRTLHRLLWSRRGMLEWVTADRTRESTTLQPGAFVLYMWPAPVIAAVVGLLVWGFRPAIASAPLLMLWGTAPLFAYWKSRREEDRYQQMKETAGRDARLNAHHFWNVFSTSLPADLALKPSSSNLGRSLLWINAAHELGVIGTCELLEQLDSALAKFSVQSESCRKGINIPQQIIIHEIGSPATFLSTFSSRCKQVVDKPFFDQRVVSGFMDSVRLIRNEFVAVSKVTPAGAGDVFLDYLHEEILACLTFLEESSGENIPQTNSEWRRFLRTMTQRAAIVELIVNTFVQQCPTINVEALSFWTNHFLRQARSFNRDLQAFAPWLRVRTAHIDQRIVDDLDHVTSLGDAVNSLQGTLDQLSELNEHELSASVDRAFETARNMSSQCSSLAITSQLKLSRFDFPLLFDEEYRLLRNQFYMSMAQGERI